MPHMLQKPGITAKRSGTILIVDDEERIRRIYRAALELEGFRIEEAATILQARQMMLDASVELILLDIELPQLDGSVLYEISRAFHRDVKVIVVSVHPVHEQRKHISEAYAYHDKSSGLDSLIEKVRLAFGEPTA